VPLIFDAQMKNEIQKHRLIGKSGMRLFYKKGIVKKISFLIITILSLLSVIAILGILANRHIYKVFQRFFYEIPHERTINDVKTAITDYIMSANDYLITGAPEERENSILLEKRIRTALEHCYILARDEEKHLTELVEGDFGKIKKLPDEIFSFNVNVTSDLEQAGKIMKKMDKLAIETRGHVKEMLKIHEDHMAMSLNDTEKRWKSLYCLMIVIDLIILAFILSVFIYNSRYFLYKKTPLMLYFSIVVMFTLIIIVNILVALLLNKKIYVSFRNIIHELPHERIIYEVRSTITEYSLLPCDYFIYPIMLSPELEKRIRTALRNFYNSVREEEIPLIKKIEEDFEKIKHLSYEMSSLGPSLSHSHQFGKIVKKREIAFIEIRVLLEELVKMNNHHQITTRNHAEGAWKSSRPIAVGIYILSVIFILVLGLIFLASLHKESIEEK
jgi:predicted PurR-regulated permease PerM